MGSERSYRLTPAAEHDLVEIWRYTARQWSLEQAETYQDQLVAAFEGLAARRNVNGGAKVGHGGGAKPGQLLKLCAMARALLI